MPRTARIAPGGMVFHVLNRGVGRRRLFLKDADFEAFERTLEGTGQPTGDGSRTGGDSTQRLSRATVRQRTLGEGHGGAAPLGVNVAIAWSPQEGSEPKHVTIAGN